MNHMKTGKRRPTLHSISKYHTTKQSNSSLNTNIGQSNSGINSSAEDGTGHQLNKWIEHNKWQVVLEDQVSELFGFKAQKEQIDCLEVLQAKKDLILLAKTGFGKSVIFQAMPLLDPENPRVCIVIMPLIALQDDQA